MATQEDRIKQLGWELGQAIQTVLANSFDRSFSDVVCEYRQVEEDFLARPGGNEFHSIETRRRVAEAILLAAHSHQQPLDTCRNAWNDLVGLGFTDFQTRCTESWLYADCCLFNFYPRGVPNFSRIHVPLDEIFYDDTAEHRRLVEAASRGRGGYPTWQAMYRRVEGRYYLRNESICLLAGTVVPAYSARIFRPKDFEPIPSYSSRASFSRMPRNDPETSNLTRH